MKKSKTQIKASRVSFDEDGLVALYIGEDLVHEGHCNDSIHSVIDGWIACLEYQGNDIKEDHFYVDFPEDTYPEEAPKTLKALLKEYKRREE